MSGRAAQPAVAPLLARHGTMVARVSADLRAGADDLDGPRRIGIDKSSDRRHHRYPLVAVDHDRKRLVRRRRREQDHPARLLRHAPARRYSSGGFPGEHLRRCEEGHARFLNVKVRRWSACLPAPPEVGCVPVHAARVTPSTVAVAIDVGKNVFAVSVTDAG